MVIKVLLDSGVSHSRNIGDNAILEVTLAKFQDCETKVLKADYLLQRETRTFKDLFHLLRLIIWCNLYYVCCGGLFKTIIDYRNWRSHGHPYILRKLIALMFARLMRKTVVFGPQTVYLKGFWRILFKMSVGDIVMSCRDNYSFIECQHLGIRCKRENDVLFYPFYVPQKLKHTFNRVIGFDQRYHLADKRIYERCLQFKKMLVEHGFTIKEIPTINTDLDWVDVERAFANVDLAVCVSFHAAVFAVNAGVSTICVYGDEYYRRKFSVFKKGFGFIEKPF